MRPGRATLEHLRWSCWVVVPSFALLVAGWHRLFLNRLVPIDGNTLTFSFPTWRILLTHRDLLQLPLWNPYRNLGEPLLADPQTTAGYPLFWLLSALPRYVDFVSGWVTAHTLIAALFMGLLALRLYGERAASAAAAVVAGLNGFFTARLTFLNHFASAAWLPAILYFQTVRSPIGLGICLALQWLAGFPPFSILSGLAVLILALTQGRAGLVCLAKAVGWAAGLAAFQLLPFLELFAQSTRSLTLSANFASEYALAWNELLAQLFVPQWFGWSVQSSGDPAIVTFYVGVFALGLACWGIVRGASRERRIAAAVALFAALSLGDQLPGYADLGLLRVFRFPANWLLLATVGLALLCAAGIARLPDTRWRWLAVAVVALDLVLFAQVARVAWAEDSFLSQPPPLARDVRASSGPVRIYHSDRLMQLWGRGSLGVEDDYLLMMDHLAPSYGMAFDVQDARSPQTLSLRIARDFQRRMGKRSNLLDAAGVAWVVSIDEQAERVERKSLRIWRNPAAKQRIFIAGATPGEVELVDYAPGRAEAVIRVEQPARIVFAEVDHPGWRVSLDGESVSHTRFEDTFPEVAVTSGTHVVVFAFEPLAFRLGALVSAAITIALLITSARHLRHPERG